MAEAHTEEAAACQSLTGIIQESAPHRILVEANIYLFMYRLFFYPDNVIKKKKSFLSVKRQRTHGSASEWLHGSWKCYFVLRTLLVISYLGYSVTLKLVLINCNEEEKK